MAHPWVLLGGLALIGVVFVLAPVMGSVYCRVRGTRWLRCPETGLPAAVGLDARHAAWIAAYREPFLRIRSCSLWPRRALCAQRCRRLPEIAGAETPLRQTTPR
jgi:hypothetical protein